MAGEKNLRLLSTFGKKSTYGGLRVIFASGPRVEKVVKTAANGAYSRNLICTKARKARIWAQDEQRKKFRAKRWGGEEWRSYGGNGGGIQHLLFRPNGAGDMVGMRQL